MLLLIIRSSVQFKVTTMLAALGEEQLGIPGWSNKIWDELKFTYIMSLSTTSTDVNSCDQLMAVQFQGFLYKMRMLCPPRPNKIALFGNIAIYSKKSIGDR